MTSLRSLLVLPVLLVGCVPVLDDDSVADDDSVGDDDTTADDDDSVDDDDSMSDDDTVGDDDDDDDSTGDDDDSVGCDIDSLLFEAYAAGPDSVPSNFFSEGTPVTLVAQLWNACGDGFTFTTSSGCLFSPWSLTSSNGEGSGMGCDAAITDWWIDGEGQLIESWDQGALSAGDYTWQIGFEPGGWTFEVPFSIGEVVIGVR